MLLLIFFSLILSHANLGKRLSHALSLQSVATQSLCKKINSKCTTKIIFGLTTNGHEYFRAYKVISENSWLKPKLFVVKTICGVCLTNKNSCLFVKFVVKNPNHSWSNKLLFFFYFLVLAL